MEIKPKNKRTRSNITTSLILFAAFIIVLLIFAGNFRTTISNNLEACQTRPQPVTIHVVFPEYRNYALLNNAIMLHQRRATKDTGGSWMVKYSVIAQEESEIDQDKVINLVGDRANIVYFSQPNLVGGGPLFRMFKMTFASVNDADIIIWCDTDALIIANGWDRRIYELFEDRDLVMAAINPRKGPFMDQAEWNWMAVRNDFYRKRVLGWRKMEHHDWGHWFTEQAKEAGKKYHLWSKSREVWKEKSPMVCGDEKDELFALHYFFSSRKHNENLTLTRAVNAEQEDLIAKWASTDKPTFKGIDKIRQRYEKEHNETFRK